MCVLHVVIWKKKLSMKVLIEEEIPPKFYRLTP